MAMIWQNAPAMSLESGCYDGITRVEDLRQFGNLGLGAFDHLDGEMVGVDGIFYQVFADSRAEPAAASATLPFCMVTEFTGSPPTPLPPDLTPGTLPAFLDSLGLSPNLVYTMRVEGSFRKLRTRCLPRQERPYPPLFEVVKSQPEFFYPEISGTMVGFRSPGYVGHLTPPGHHLHFVSADRTVGGHVLSFEGTIATVSTEHVDRQDISYPTGGDFASLNVAST